MPVFQECAEDGEEKGVGAWRRARRADGRREGRGEVEERGEDYGVRKHEKASRWLFPAYCADFV